MKKTTFDTIWDQIRQKYGVYLRLIEILPEAQLQTRPILGMRTPAELIAHLSSGIVRAIMQGIAARAKAGNAAASDAVETGSKARPMAELGWRFALRYECSRR